MDRAATVLVTTEWHLRARAGLGNGYCNYKQGVIRVTGGWLTGTQRMAKRRIVCEIWRFESGKRRGRWWLREDMQLIAWLGLNFAGRFRDSERAVISLIWGRRGRIIKIQSVRDIEDKDLPPGVEKAPFWCSKLRAEGWARKRSWRVVSFFFSEHSNRWGGRRRDVLFWRQFGFRTVFDWRYAGSEKGMEVD